MFPMYGDLWDIFLLWTRISCGSSSGSFLHPREPSNCSTWCYIHYTILDLAAEARCNVYLHPPLVSTLFYSSIPPFLTSWAPSKASSIIYFGPRVRLASPLRVHPSFFPPQCRLWCNPIKHLNEGVKGRRDREQVDRNRNGGTNLTEFQSVQRMVRQKKAWRKKSIMFDDTALAALHRCQKPGKWY